MSDPSPARRDRRLVLILGAALALVLILLVASLLRPTAEAPSPAAQPSATGATPDQDDADTDLSRREPGDPMALGAVDAPVVLIEYADFRCPFCGVYARETLPILTKEYVDTGKLRIEWRDMPIFGDESFAAAVAGRAAGEQGMFWEYNAEVFSHAGSGHQALPRKKLIAIAEKIGIPDVTAFTKALDDPELADIVRAEAQQSQAIGVNSTPTFLIGRTPILGAQPVDAFRQAIDAELARTGQ